MHYQKFASTTQKVQVDNEQCVAVLFVIPVVIDCMAIDLKCSHWYQKYMTM